MTPAAAIYDIALRTGELSDQDGRSLPVRTWLADADASDAPMVQACTGPTLDVGCGPGRLTAALTARGVPALGIDISARAVALTRARGAMAMRRDVFAMTAGWHRWDHLLLADGNIGIGADPVRLLSRCASLVSPRGTIVADVEAPGTGLRTVTMRLSAAGELSDPFRWSHVGVDAVEAVAHAAGLHVVATGVHGSRWQVTLVRACSRGHRGAE
ncbi:class I SAM-dependent methyltransferase [Williamsia sp. CHRR-6]|uniref:methyltransferase domain-containing protein n=1 Tax=Williamsia sp. CHRR-6 TaxID=2835871 RepID=UPI001BD9E0DF|nr:class I SAM-dependent methyltransferase [Williamsia sp. CHRR-6]MBT0566369.1 class I SAM-dependent methyltransferase [Williamsia sp. CHRR-6]